MKSQIIMCALSCVVLTQGSYGVQYRVKEYDDRGPICIKFKQINKFTKEEEKLELRSLREDDENKLVEIRRKPEVYGQYADRTCPTEEETKNVLHTKLLPRVSGDDSLFPFVLRKIIKTSGGNPSKSYKVLGLLNIGAGFKPEDRQYGYYIDPGRKLTEEEIKTQGRLQGHSHYENWGRGIGGAAVKVSTHFVMLFHENGPKTITLQPKKSTNSMLIPIQKKRFSGVLSSTVYPDNTRSIITLSKAGLRKLSYEEVEARGFSKDVKSIIKIDESTKEIVKDYYELTWEEFKKNEENGLYQ